ncbi:Bifunctional purine biosynthetic protein ade1 [Phlyctochytrium planicorne]|nr:Bifunctional purine biosynthetic protein ade1 [Phlyctochytrium planicorne]
MAVVESNCPELKLIARGKVRDLYDVDEKHLLFVATDRISAFDVIMKNGIPKKGVLLTSMSEFWFDFLKDTLPNHLVTSDLDKMPAPISKYEDQLKGRSMLVRKLKILPVEAIVRGYITGSGWAEYKKKGTVCDIPLPAGLQECAKLEKPLFTPSTKAELGDHVVDIIGKEYADQMEKAALQLYEKASAYALSKGIIIADTKFEFGVDENGKLVLADEVLTPDSSRFWPASSYAPGKSQPSYDKQYLRDYLESIKFDKSNGIELPSDVTTNTLSKYKEASTIITGKVPTL